VIAESGYGHASFARIADRAGLYRLLGATWVDAPRKFPAAHGA
jgi:hypothetical protein